MKKRNKTGNNKNLPVKKDLIQGEDYYIDEQGRWVFSEAYHLRRGYCCNNGCKHCPYGYHEIKNWL